jgi:uncharacterized protein (DUF2147 family)
MNKFCLLLPAGLFLCVLSANAQNITGVWLTEKDESKIEIYERDGAFFGKVIWAKEQTEKVQKNIGVIILKNFVRQKDGTYNGTVFAPHINRTVKGTITPKSENEIILRGFLGISLFGSSQHWRRVKE